MAKRHVFHGGTAGLAAMLLAGCAPVTAPADHAPADHAPAPSPAGTEWLAEDIGGGGIIDRSHITLTLGDGGRASGSGGCNRYRTGYELSGDALRFEPAAATRMACAPALMEQESRYLGLLGQVVRWRIEPTGALILTTADDATLRFFATEAGEPPQ